MRSSDIARGGGNSCEGATMSFFLMPTKDSNGQWWHEGEKVELIVLSEEEKQAYLGRVGERLKPSDCKSDVDDYEGSNPSPSTNLLRM